MIYTQIKITYSRYPKRLYRILAIKGDPNLLVLGGIIARSFGAWFEHGYLFQVKDTSYIFDSWLEDFPDEKALPISKYSLSDLPSKFSFLYDTGEGWEFTCQKIKNGQIYHDETSEDAPLAFLIEGKGQGIFENDRWTFERYMEGEIDPELDEDDEDNGIYLPMNLEFDKFGDFESPLNHEYYEYFDDDFDDLQDALSDEEEDDIDEEDHIEQATHMLGMLVAFDCFNHEEVNKVFRRLIQKYDINDAYQMILDACLDVMINADPTTDDDALELLRLQAIKKLK